MYLAKGLVESTHKVPTSHYQYVSCLQSWRLSWRGCRALTRGCLCVKFDEPAITNLPVRVGEGEENDEDGVDGEGRDQVSGTVFMVLFCRFCSTHSSSLVHTPHPDAQRGVCAALHKFSPVHPT